MANLRGIMGRVMGSRGAAGGTGRRGTTGGGMGAGGVGGAGGARGRGKDEAIGRGVRSVLGRFRR